MNRHGTLRLLAVTAALSFAFAAAACGDNGGSGDGSQTLQLNGENTALTLDEAVVAVLKQKKVQVTPVEPAAPDKAGSVLFPITRGQVNSETLAGSIQHSGGLTFTIGRETLEITDFVADTESGVLLATAGAAELPILDLDFTGLKKSQEGGAIVASGIKAKLTGYGAAAMNSILGVKFFKEGLGLGELTVTATAVS